MDQKGANSSLPKWQIYKSTLATLVNSENFRQNSNKFKTPVQLKISTYQKFTTFKIQGVN